MSNIFFFNAWVAIHWGVSSINPDSYMSLKIIGNGVLTLMNTFLVIGLIECLEKKGRKSLGKLLFSMFSASFFYTFAPEQWKYTSLWIIPYLVYKGFQLNKSDKEFAKTAISIDNDMYILKNGKYEHENLFFTAKLAVCSKNPVFEDFLKSWISAYNTGEDKVKLSDCMLSANIVNKELIEIGESDSSATGERLLLNQKIAKRREELLTKMSDLTNTIKTYLDKERSKNISSGFICDLFSTESNEPEKQLSF